MNQQQFKKAWEAIETDVLAGRMSVSGGMARVTLLALEYAHQDPREARLSREAIVQVESRGWVERPPMRPHAPHDYCSGCFLTACGEGRDPSKPDGFIPIT